MKTVSLREYTRYPHRYMKPGEYLLTKRGKPYMRLTVWLHHKERNGTIKKSELMCKHKGCKRGGEYHKGYCMEHWREGK
jgi:hypothetical protein